MPTDTDATRSARTEFLAALDSTDFARAVLAARTFLGQRPPLHQLSFVRRAVAKLPPERFGLVPLRVALLSSFSVEFLHDPLMALAFLDGLHIDLFQPGFGQFRQEILDPASGLNTHRPDVAILAIEGKDLVPALYGHLSDETPGAIDKAVAEAREEIVTLIRTFRERSDATLLVHNFAPPPWRRYGILEGHSERGQAEFVHELNQALYDVCRDLQGAYVVDYAGLVGRAGAMHWYDRRMEHYARAPISQAKLPDLAAEYLKFLRGLAGKTKKCLVLDLDNTLWGGVLGEDGLQGLQLGPTYPGSAYLAFQEAVLGLHQRGVILAIASKNNAPDVEEVFASHPHMMLKKEHFAQAQINWGPKSKSIVEIARRLNIGLEHMVFVDDSPAECDQVAAALPMVTVIPLPGPPEHFVDVLLERGLFESVSISAEDRRRGELYKQHDQAEELQRQSGSLEDFYARLDMEVTFAPVRAASMARAAQLTQKTNQFNVTTVRYTESEMAARCANRDWLVISVQVRDRFGDNGIVGLMMARMVAGELHIDTFLLSCRVIGRDVETAMLACLCQQARHRGARCLRGRVVPTAKNQPARNLYDRHRFHQIAEAASGETTWLLDLDSRMVSFPQWFKIITEIAA